MVHAEHLFVWWWVRLRVPMDVVGTQIDEAGRVHGPSMLVVVRSSRLLWGLPNCDGTMALTLQGIKGSTTSDVSKEMSESFPEVPQQKSSLSKLPWPNSILQPSWGSLEEDMTSHEFLSYFFPQVQKRINGGCRSCCGFLLLRPLSSYAIIECAASGDLFSWRRSNEAVSWSQRADPRHCCSYNIQLQANSKASKHFGNFVLDMMCSGH